MRTSSRPRSTSAFEIVESPIPELVGAHAVVWTTTPWTIPVNQAIAYGPEIDYVSAAAIAGSECRPLRSDQRCSERVRRTVPRRRDLAESFRGAASSATSRPAPPSHGLPLDWSERARHEGTDLAGTVARHPMHELGGFFAKPRPFLPGDFVTTEQGTGLVHMAPDHGEDDFLLCKAHGIDPVFAVDDGGFYRDDWEWLGGQGSVINAKFNAPDGPICSDLREARRPARRFGGLPSTATRTAGAPRPRSSSAARPQWFIPMDRGEPEALARDRPEGDRRDALGAGEGRRTGCARWSRAGPTG